MALNDLNHRQRLFVEAYLGEASGNASEAARMAGYANPRQMGQRQLTKVAIQAAVAGRVTEAALSANEVLARLSEMASSDMADFTNVDDETGSISLDLRKAKRQHKLGLVKKLTPTKFGWSLELYDKQAALVHLGKYHGLFADKVPNNMSDLSNEDLEAIAKGKGGGRA